MFFYAAILKNPEVRGAVDLSLKNPDGPGRWFNFDESLWVYVDCFSNHLQGEDQELLVFCHQDFHHFGV